MEPLLLEILDELRKRPIVDERMLTRIINKHNTGIKENSDHFTKKKILYWYMRTKQNMPDLWRTWDIDEALEIRLMQLLRLKPRRTSSGVATITVMAKPWPCSSNCLYCPNDVRMPKSYMTDEPVCQRAERAYFDPFIQASARLKALVEMGHVTDKVEIIVSGGTWCDYPESYQIWFIEELFRALNDEKRAEHALERKAFYERCGLTNSKEAIAQIVSNAQSRVNRGEATYNSVLDELYGSTTPWESAQKLQHCSIEELVEQQKANENAEHRVVGLVVETRPDTVTCDKLRLIRKLGCTKVQMGVQSLDADVLRANCRNSNLEQLQSAFVLARLFGFKLHTHFMVNLLGSTPEKDIADYRNFMNHPAFMPDEVKLYPCALVDGTGLMRHYEDGSWRPYPEEELVNVLVQDMKATPAFTRISRMIRDISAHDIVAGNKKSNLRQQVEEELQNSTSSIDEIRYREIKGERIALEDLKLSEVLYSTTATDEVFLQWVTPQNHIAGFLRLSLPKTAAFERYGTGLPVSPDEAMIREVHVYGQVAALQNDGGNAQHLGLGKRLVERACEIAKAKGYAKINVISAIGTRGYYRKLGFFDNELYLQKPLQD